MQISRLCFKKLWAEVAGPEISILLGPRQTGKSTLLRQLEVEAMKKGHATSFYDLEQPSDLGRLAGEPQQVIRELTQKGGVIFLDEFHCLRLILH